MWRTRPAAATVPPLPAARSGVGDLFGRRGIDGDHGVVRSEPGTVGERDLHPGSEVWRLLRVVGGGLEAVGSTVDEADPEREQMAIPMVEPRLGGRAVEHPVGLVVAPIHLELKLKVGGEVRAGIPPARVEGGQHAGHF